MVCWPTTASVEASATLGQGPSQGRDGEVDDRTLPKWRMYINVRASDIAARPGMLSGGDRTVLLTGREQRQGPQV
jgi:hypothetical protein